MAGPPPWVPPPPGDPTAGRAPSPHCRQQLRERVCVKPPHRPATDSESRGARRNTKPASGPVKGVLTEGTSQRTAPLTRRAGSDSARPPTVPAAHRAPALFAASLQRSSGPPALAPSRRQRGKELLPRPSGAWPCRRPSSGHLRPPSPRRAARRGSPTDALSARLRHLHPPPETAIIADNNNKRPPSTHVGQRPERFGKSSSLFRRNF